MRSKYTPLLTLIILFGACAAFISCGDKEPEVADFTGDKVEYTLREIDGSGLSGRVTLEERVDNSTRITVDLNGSFAADLPVQIRNGDEVEGGEILVILNPVSFSSKTSVTEVSQTLGGSQITFQSLLTVNGHVRVNSDPLDLASVGAAVGLGENELLSDSESYTISESNGSGVNGTLTFTKRKAGHTLATLSFTGTQDGLLHPAGIYQNNSDLGGQEIIQLNAIDGSSGVSETSIRQDKDGKSVTYEDLLIFDGHCIVNLSATNPVVVARSDIAGNGLTGNFVEYRLDSLANPDIKGIATLQEKRSGEARLVIQLENTPTGGIHPAGIYAGLALDNGNEKFVSLNPVDGDNGESITHIEASDDGSDDQLTYAELADYAGYLRVELNPSDATVVAQGDFGSNGFTGNKVEYAIVEQGGSGITGLATLEERYNGNTFITMVVEGTTSGANHQAHIHENSLSTSGSIRITFNNDIIGATGISQNNISQFDAGGNVTYSDLLEYDGHILIHQGPTGGTPVAGADIGSNAN